MSFLIAQGANEMLLSEPQLMNRDMFTKKQRTMFNRSGQSFVGEREWGSKIKYSLSFNQKLRDSVLTMDGLVTFFNTVLGQTLTITSAALTYLTSGYILVPPTVRDAGVSEGCNWATFDLEIWQ